MLLVTPSQMMASPNDSAFLVLPKQKICQKNGEMWPTPGSILLLYIRAFNKSIGDISQMIRHSSFYQNKKVDKKIVKKMEICGLIQEVFYGIKEPLAKGLGTSKLAV